VQQKQMRLQNHSGEFHFDVFHFHMSVQCREEESECRWMLMFLVFWVYMLYGVLPLYI
jgi:hypothetical protein